MKYRWIIIQEDGTAYKINTITSTDLTSVELGIIRIIDTVEMKELVDPVIDKWENLDEWPYGKE